MRVEKYPGLQFLHTFLGILACLLVFPFATLSQENPCDPYLLQPKENPLGYRLRGNRCEGQYIQQVGSTPLSVASLTHVFENYDLNSDQPLQVDWPKLGDQETRLRAHGIKWKLYYRMDAVSPVGLTSFQWPVGILSALNISKSAIGIVGWTHREFGEETQKIYLPLRISQSGEMYPKDSYRLILWPGVQLEEVYVSLARVDDEGHPKSFLQEGKPLGYGYYPAQRAIPLRLTGFQESGIYNVTISATLQSGSDTTLRLFVYHSKI